VSFFDVILRCEYDRKNICNSGLLNDATGQSYKIQLTEEIDWIIKESYHYNIINIMTFLLLPSSRLAVYLKESQTLKTLPVRAE
jgi:hypothetical protein